MQSTQPPANRQPSSSRRIRVREILSARSLLLHPFLFTLYPVLAMLSNNIQELRPSDANRSIIVVLVAASMMLFVLRWILRDWQKAGGITSLMAMLFFSYGHVYATLKEVTLGGEILGRHRFLIPLWIALLAIGTWFVLVRLRNLPQVTRYLNGVALIAIIIPAINIIRHAYYAQQVRFDQANSDPTVSDILPLRGDESTPDVYYIILDGYARTDILKTRYGYDNSSFVQFLRDRGFYVAEESMANYPRTVFSLASSLNMEYLPEIEYDIQPGRGLYAFYRPIQHSRLRMKLESFGYATVAFATGYGLTELFDADYVFTPDMTKYEVLQAFDTFNAFEGMLLHSTAALILTDIDRIRNTSIGQFIQQRQQVVWSNHRDLILSSLEHLKDTPDISGPKFVFAHIISPHRPYFFGPAGEEAEQHEPFTFTNIDPPLIEQEMGFYRDQLTYITSRLEEVIDVILAKSEQPPIIIIQADHGPGIGIDWENPTEETLRDRMAIFNVYLLPQSCHNQLYSSITPVNTFRVLLNCVFMESYELLKDRSYYSEENEASVEFDNFVAIEELLD